MPVCFEQVSQMLAGISTALRESEPGTLLAALLASDGFLVSLLWHTALRGDNAGRLRDVGVITPEGDPACSQLWSAGRSGGELEPDRLYFFRPDGTKSQRAANIGRVPIKVLVESEQGLCCARWLQQWGMEKSFESLSAAKQLRRLPAACATLPAQLCRACRDFPRAMLMFTCDLHPD